MSTPSRCAKSRACAVARTLNAMITASDALANWMSLSVICPTPASSTRTFTSSPLCFSTVAWIASALPCTSALIRTATSFCTPAWMRASIWSSVPRAPALTPTALSRVRRARNSVISRARLSSSTTTSGSPAEGMPANPSISTGIHGPALVVQDRAHPAPLVAGNDDLAWVQRALLHQHGGNRSAAAIEPAFDHRALGTAIRVGLQIEDLGLQHDRFRQLIQAGLLQRRDLHVLRLAAHVLDHHLVAQQLLAHAGGIGV